ncbi:MAG: 2-hydroxychromene-2-carboxylate isomerase [Nevskia sp.]|nr:2-hydroxychromene-2-carboxylate isomerase [Nevskia sp.]
MNSESQQVQVFFDPVSPYVWLAFREIGALQAAGLVVDCRPVLFAGLLNAHGQKGPAEIPAKRAYVFGDVLRVAAQKGYAFKGPPSHPFNPLRALRMCIAIDQADERLKFAQALLEGCWELGEDLSERQTLERIAERCGLDGPQLNAAAERPEIKARLMEATAAAIKAGVFGVPTFCFKGELFWGGDRMGTLLWRLQHPGREDELLQDFLMRGASAQR